MVCSFRWTWLPRLRCSRVGWDARKGRTRDQCTRRGASNFPVRGTLACLVAVVVCFSRLLLVLQYFMTLLIGGLCTTWGLGVLLFAHTDEAERFIGDRLDSMYKARPDYGDIGEQEISSLTTRYIRIAYTSLVVMSAAMVCTCTERRKQPRLTCNFMNRVLDVIRQVCC